MAVDYTQFDTYKSTKSSYNSALKDAEKADYGQKIKNILSWTAAGSAFGIPGAIFGYGAGLLYENFNRPTSNEDALYSQVRTNITNSYNSASTAQDTRNQYIIQAQYNMAQTKSNFASTYGKDSFNMLEATITTLLDMDSSTEGQIKMSELLGGLSRDSIVGDIETRVLNLYQAEKDDRSLRERFLDFFNKRNKNVEKNIHVGGSIDKDTLDTLNSTYLNLEDLGKYYVQSLYENIVNADSTYGDTASQLSEQQKLAAEQLELEFGQTMTSTSQKFAELFLNQRSSNISNAQAMGESEAASGASGIKASKSSRTNNLVTKMSQDVANTSYAIMYDSYRKQLKADIENGRITREQIGFQYSAQISNLRKQVQQATENDINTWFHSATQSASSIADQEMATDTNMAAAKAGEDFLKNHDQGYYGTGRKYIYNTNTATV